MKKFKVSYFIIEGNKKSELPVMQYITFKSTQKFPDVEKLEAAINSTLPQQNRCELDCYSPA